MPPPAGHLERPDKFDGANFKRWQQKMLFYLTTLGLARFLIEDEPPSDEKSDKETLMAVDAWKNSDYLYWNYVLNGLSDALYGVYCGTKSAKELWETLDRKYKTENAGSEKFVVGKFLDYMMVDTKPLMSQVHELQVLIQELLAERMFINEAFQALIRKLRIEDDNRRSDSRSMKAGIKANVVEHDSSSKNKKKPGKSSKLGPKGGISKNAKFQGKYFNCDKMGHRAADCRLSKRKRNIETTMMEHITREVDEIDLSAVVSKVNLVGSNPREWWIDTGATRHVCADRSMFTSFEPKANGEKLFMGNSAYSEIQGEDIRKNLVSGSLLSKHGFRLVFESVGAAVTWKSSKQTVIARFMMESEFIALDKCGKEAEWLRQFLEDIPSRPNNLGHDTATRLENDTE
nr:uncharacterized protein LOC125419077 [Ziziphus jujuba var. spinosa]